MSSLHDTLRRRVDDGTVPGAVGLVARGDDVEVVAVGSVDVEGTAPMARDSIFRIASVSKPVTAAAVLALVEDGRLALDAPVEEWLPELGEADGGPYAVLAGRRRGPGGASGHGRGPAELPGRLGLPRRLLPVGGAGAARVPAGRPRALPPTGPGRVARRAGEDPDGASAGRRVAVQHLLGHPGRPGRPRLGLVLPRLPGGAVLRAAGHDGHRVRGAGVEAVPLHHRLHPGRTGRPGTGRHPGRRLQPAPGLPSGAGGLVSTADDLLAFHRMLGANGTSPDGTRVLSPPR